MSPADPPDSMTRREFGHLVSSALAAVGQETSGGSTTTAWRADFPALAQSVNGRPLVYLDSAATTLRPSAVIQAVTRFYAGETRIPPPRCTRWRDARTTST